MSSEQKRQALPQFCFCTSAKYQGFCLTPPKNHHITYVSKMGVAQGRHFDTIYTKDGKEQTQKTPKHITQCLIDVFEKKKKTIVS